MTMTPAQKATIAAYIAADPTLSQLPPGGDSPWTIAAALNAPSSGVIVWRTEVTAEEIMGNGFVWTAVDGLGAGKARIWEWMTRFGGFNPSKPNIRAGLSECFGAASAMTAAILPHCKRTASVFEQLLATGTGTDASPATMGAEGPISPYEVSALMGW